MKKLVYKGNKRDFMIWADICNLKYTVAFVSKSSDLAKAARSIYKSVIFLVLSKDNPLILNEVSNKSLNSSKKRFFL